LLADNVYIWPPDIQGAQISLRLSAKNGGLAAALLNMTKQSSSALAAGLEVWEQ
jgi:hypothetical protein